jgi:uncharacterized protein DUF4372
MIGHSSLFSQLLLVTNRNQFQKRVKEFEAEKAAKGFSCWGYEVGHPSIMGYVRLFQKQGT